MLSAAGEEEEKEEEEEEEQKEEEEEAEEEEKEEKDWAMAQEQGQATVQAQFLLLHRRCRQEIS